MIKLKIGAKSLTNPLVVGVRCCEATLSQTNEDDDKAPDVTIQLAGLGVFDQRTVEIWRKLAAINAAVKRKVTAEKRWLSYTRVLTYK